MSSDAPKPAGAPYESEGPLAGVPSATVPDWSREACSFFSWDPSRQLVRAVRALQRVRGRKSRLGRALTKLALARYRFWSIVSGAELSADAMFAGGLRLLHPTGVIVHPGVTLGPNCMLFQQVTLGPGPRPGVPMLGGHVDIGAGAKVLGGVHIGDHAVIGANAVVVDDVPPGAVVVGIPALVTSNRLEGRGAERAAFPPS